ncbi:ComEA family DNA-binding protein [Pedobacter sp. MW01-1-1]|uniref:ComEA family DNA-binding protein n=1 Tax=Pedobacter sp. MW01-1-1 TaxID=3383027 RepID=UPI003FEF0D02
MKIWLNKHFGFSKGEFNGLLLLIIIIIVLKTIPLVYKYTKPIEKDNANLLAQLQQIELVNKPDFRYKNDKSLDQKASGVAERFPFDPNTLDLEGWQRLGLSAKQAGSILNYVAKGGKFYKATDLKRMYTISPAMYERLLPYVAIEDMAPINVKKDIPFEKKEYVKKEALVVDINTADSAKLDEIKGIGPAFAKRIVKYRDRLGGFYKKEQLMEVYGLDSVKYNEIKSQISLSPNSLKTINVNTAEFNDLKTNPYLSYKQINALIQYRKQHGKFTSIADLKKVIILPEETIQKIKPYLAF